MADFADALRRRGMIHLDAYTRHLGVGIDTCQSQISLCPLMHEICNRLPVFAFKALHSKTGIWLVDAYNIPPHAALATLDMQRKDRAILDAREPDQAALDVHLREELDATIALFDALENEEFLENVPHPAGAGTAANPEDAAHHQSKRIIKKYPDLANKVMEILKEHGVGAAEARRRNDKAHTIGCSCTTVSNILFAEHNIDVCATTVWRLYEPSRSNDMRAIHNGGRYGLIAASTGTVRNSQFVSDHVRGYNLTCRNRDAMECMGEIASLYGASKVAWLSADGMSCTPLIVDANSHLIGSCKGHTLDGDDRDYYDHHQVLGSKLLMDNTGIVVCRTPGTQ